MRVQVGTAHGVHGAMPSVEVQTKAKGWLITSLIGYAMDGGLWWTWHGESMNKTQGERLNDACFCGLSFATPQNRRENDLEHQVLGRLSGDMHRSEKCERVVYPTKL